MIYLFLFYVGLDIIKLYSNNVFIVKVKLVIIILWNCGFYSKLN